jgi:hypothetical protein
MIGRGGVLVCFGEGEVICYELFSATAAALLMQVGD